MVASSPGARILRLLRRSLTTQSVAGAAGIVAGGFIASRLLGLIRSMAIADTFGTEPELAAYWVAFRIPDLIFQLIAGATLSAAFIPTFSRTVMHEGEREGWSLASNILNLISLSTFVVTALAFVLAPLIVPLLAPGLGEASGREDELRALAIELTRLMLLSPLMFGISGMLSGILNARQHFLAPAIAPLFYNLGIILGAVILADRWGIHGLACGVVIGSLGHLLVQLPALRIVGMRWQPTINIASQNVRDVLRLMGPRVLGLAAAQVNLVVVLFFASFISDEAISAINFAFLIMLLPVGVIGMAIATAVFPRLAQHGAALELDRLSETVQTTLRMILFFSIPASIGLAILAEPIVRLFLQRGAFDEASTNLVVQALVFYALAAWAHAAIEIVSRGFYALSDTRTPVLFALIAMLLNVALCAAFVDPFGIRGLAAATSLAAIVELSLLMWLLDQRMDGFEIRVLTSSIVRTLGATLVMAQVLVLLSILLNAAGADPDELLGSFALITIGGLFGLLTFLATATLLRSPECRATIRWINKIGIHKQANV